MALLALAAVAVFVPLVTRFDMLLRPFFVPPDTTWMDKSE